jgi:hypothetical protein
MSRLQTTAVSSEQRKLQIPDLVSQPVISGPHWNKRCSISQIRPPVRFEFRHGVPLLLVPKEGYL